MPTCTHGCKVEKDLLEEQEGSRFAILKEFESCRTHLLIFMPSCEITKLKTTSSHIGALLIVQS